MPYSTAHEPQFMKPTAWDGERYGVKLCSRGFGRLALAAAIASGYCLPSSRASADTETAVQLRQVDAASDEQYDAAFRCPESFGSDEERRQALMDYMNWALARHPHWTVKQVLDYRYDLLVRHRCTETLRNIERNGAGAH
jgi:hypothetical protein